MNLEDLNNIYIQFYLYTLLNNFFKKISVELSFNSRSKLKFSCSPEDECSLIYNKKEPEQYSSKTIIIMKMFVIKNKFTSYCEVSYVVLLDCKKG